MKNYFGWSLENGKFSNRENLAWEEVEVLCVCVLFQSVHFLEYGPNVENDSFQWLNIMLNSYANPSNS